MDSNQLDSNQLGSSQLNGKQLGNDRHVSNRRDSRSLDTGTAEPSSLTPTHSRRIKSLRPRSNKWLHYAAINRERGMSTAEYAVGTIAACAFAALLFKIVSSPEVQEMLTSLINRALNTTTG
ncbi:DUF4244 domain-containing protein [Nonomuraea sp. NPDC050404]|uniref:DUF4244 domain-containing protein n=1 Tax=Nonomuraea sp. NPDC050404 TaxID=3155783 RepID=UPI0034107EE6